MFLKLRRILPPEWIVIGGIVLVACGVLIANRPFLLRAWESSVSSMSTGTLAVVGGLLYPLANALRIRRREGRAGLKQHWRDGLKCSFYIAIIWWGVLFGYHLFWTVPERIYATANGIEVPRPRVPTVPPDTLTKMSHAKGPLLAATEPDEIAKRVGNAPRNEQPTFTESGPFTVLAGSNDYKISEGSTQQEPSEIRLYGESPAVIKAYVENGKIYVDALLDLGKEKEPLELVHNELRDMPPRWDRNLDNSAIEVVDENLVPRFQLVYKTNLTAQLCGVFHFPDRAAVINSKNVHYFQGSYENAVDIRRIFEYPSRLHHGEELPNVSAPPGALTPCPQELPFSETPLGIGPPYIREVKVSLNGANTFTVYTSALLDGLPEIVDPVGLHVASVGWSGPLMGATVGIGGERVPESVRSRFSSANKAYVVCVNRDAAHK